MLLTADWVLPVSRPPIRDGGVIIDQGLILEVGRIADLQSLGREKERYHFPDCVLMPGLVNAHTHLSLSALEGLMSPDAFDRWLPRLVAGMRSWDSDDYAASAAMGARQSLEAGVTVVGDIVYGPESLGAAAAAGLGGVFFWEVLGITAPSFYAELERMSFPSDDSLHTPRIRRGLSPHSTYTSGPDLLRAIHQAGIDLEAPVAIHLAESGAESQLLHDGSGPLRATVDRLVPGFEPPGVGGVAYLDRIQALNGATAVHLGHSIPSDLIRLASTVRGAVTCPRSNEFLSNHLPRISDMVSSGIPVGIGTDSSASNRDLDLCEEARLLLDEQPRLGSRTLIGMMTAMGAIAIGLEDHFGILECGMQADVAVFKTGKTSSPEDAIIQVGGRDSVEAVLSAGIWRLLEGTMLEEPDQAIVEKARRATETARVAIGEA